MLHSPCTMAAGILGGGGEAGHTLVELVTVVGVIAIAAALAYPALAGMRRGQDLEAAAVGTAQCLRLARWRAVVSGRRVRVVPRRGPEVLWRIVTEREAGGGWVPDGEDRTLPRGVLIAVAGPAEKVFNPDGTCSLGSLTLRAGGAEAYRLTLAPATGRVRVYRGERELGRGL